MSKITKNELHGSINDKLDKIDVLEQNTTAHSADYVKHPGYATATGSANTYAVTLNPAPTAYVDGMTVSVKINADNTGASTININGLGTKTIKKANGNDVSAGNLKTGSIYTLRYNGTNFILQGEGGSGNAVAGDVLTGKTFSNDAGDQTGTMPNRGAQIITPGTGNIAIPAGYHNGSGYVQGDVDLIASNIRSGKDIFGVLGNLVPLTNERKWATGTTTTDSNADLNISGLAFTPSIVIAWVSTDFYDALFYYNQISSTLSCGAMNNSSSKWYATTVGSGSIFIDTNSSDFSNKTMNWIAIA